MTRTTDPTPRMAAASFAALALALSGATARTTPW